MGEDCGRIAYEIKRTKPFNSQWITKLKSDVALVKADLCVIITEAMPKGIEHIGQINGVWIYSINDFREMAIVLRDNLLRVSETYSSLPDKGLRMLMLHDYLTSNEFKLQVSAVISG